MTSKIQIQLENARDREDSALAEFAMLNGDIDPETLQFGECLNLVGFDGNRAAMRIDAAMDVIC